MPKWSKEELDMLQHIAMDISRAQYPIGQSLAGHNIDHLQGLSREDMFKVENFEIIFSEYYFDRHGISREEWIEKFMRTATLKELSLLETQVNQRFLANLLSVLP